MAIFSKIASPVARAALILASLSGVNAFWRMDCHSRTGLARIDPLVDYGHVGAHAHAIHGGKNFDFTTTESSELLASDCTSCGAKEDKSAYWTPSMHFIHKNGTVVVVPQVGGMLAYYLLYGDNIKAFPQDFKMIAGDTTLRNFSGPVPDAPKSLWTADESTQFSLGQKAIGFNCLDYSKTPEASLYRHFLPDKAYLDANCVTGLRLELMFPSCWNGKDADSTNHKSHVAYPNLVMTGDCPTGFETRIPSLFYETIWATHEFAGYDGEFVLSNGDPTGYGYHGDFIHGWEKGFLQQAVDTCTNPSGELSDCPLFTLQSQDEMAQCTLDLPSELKDDDCAIGEALPGDVAIAYGPEPAKRHGTATAASSGAAYSATSKAIVPTLSYVAPSQAATDSYGGGISIANIENNGVASTQAASTTESSAATSAAAYAAAVTPAPSVPAEGPSGHIVGTTTYTSDGAVWEVAIEEVDITVTAAPSAAAKHRRHVRQHRHVGDKHNLV